MKEVEFLTKNLNAGKKLNYKVIDSRSIEILSNGLQIIETISQNNKITAIKINEELEIAVGTEFKVNIDTIKSNYIIEFIEKGVNKYTLYTHRRNLTSYYLLPMLGIKELSLNTINNFYRHYVINAYLNEELNKMYVLTRFSTYDRYNEFEKTLLKSDKIVKVTHPSPGLDLFEFNISISYLPDIQNFLKGKYSQFTLMLTNKILESCNGNKKARVYQVVTKDENLVKLMEKEWGCSFNNIDLECKPIKTEEIWQ